MLSVGRRFDSCSAASFHEASPGRSERTGVRVPTLAGLRPQKARGSPALRRVDVASARQRRFERATGRRSERWPLWRTRSLDEGTPRPTASTEQTCSWAAIRGRSPVDSPQLGRGSPGVHKPATAPPRRRASPSDLPLGMNPSGANERVGKGRYGGKEHVDDQDRRCRRARASAPVPQ